MVGGMDTPICQRWLQHRSFYRPAREVVSTAALDVGEIPDDTTAKAFVVAHHYSSTFVAARFRFGLYERGALVGVAVFSHPISTALFRGLPDPAAAVELGRLVLLDRVGANAESWFVARCFALLRAHGLSGVVSCSDPVPRSSADGAVILGGHVGTVYQALSAVYAGRNTARTLKLLPDGRVFSDRAVSKIRSRDQGWRYAAGQLVAHGADPLGEDDDARVWLRHWLARLTRPLVHGGNHRYLWALDKRDRRHLPASLPYPKMRDLGSLALPLG